MRSSRTNGNNGNGAGQDQDLQIPDDAVDGLNQSTAARASHRGLIPRARVKVMQLDDKLRSVLYLLSSPNIFHRCLI